MPCGQYSFCLFLAQHPNGGVDNAAENVAAAGLVPAQEASQKIAGVRLLSLEHGDGFLLRLTVCGAIELQKLFFRGAELDRVFGGGWLFRLACGLFGGGLLCFRCGFLRGGFLRGRLFIGRAVAALLGGVEQRALRHARELCDLAQDALGKLLFPALCLPEIRGAQTLNLFRQRLLAEIFLAPRFLDQRANGICHGTPSDASPFCRD